MKAIVYRRFGSPDVLEYVDVDKPVARDNEVLIRVRAASVNPLDWHFMRGTPYIMRAPMRIGVRRPKITRLGFDVSGEVEAVGSAVTKFKAGDEVFGICRGSFAQYACGPESSLELKPATSSFDEAAATPVGAITALFALREYARTKPGDKVLVNGAAGGVGTFAVQIAKSFGAHVTGVCSTRNVGMVRSLGADRVVDYTVENFTDGNDRFDAIVDCISNHSMSRLRRVLARDGKYVMVGGVSDGKWIGAIALMLKKVVASWILRMNTRLCLIKRGSDALRTIGALIDAGKVRPIIDRRYALNEVAHAMEYVEQGHARGKVIIAVD